MFAFASVARVFYAACCRMVFGLSSGGPHDSPAIVCHHLQFNTLTSATKARTRCDTLETTPSSPGSARARLACWFRRLAETISQFEWRIGRFWEPEQKSAMARAPSPARETRALPGVLRFT